MKVVLTSNWLSHNFSVSVLYRVWLKKIYPDENCSFAKSTNIFYY